MPRKKTIIVFPHLNDCGGDLSKKWYIEWQYHLPGTEKPKRERNYSDLNQPTAEGRYIAAETFIAEKTEWLKNGMHLQGDPTRVYEDELLYRNEAKMYGREKKSVTTSRTHLSDFLSYIREKVNTKSYENYVSKLRIFNAWLDRMNLSHIHIKNIKRDHIIQFATFLSADQNLARLSIKKYIQIIHTFFDFELEKGIISTNPAVKIPALGRVVDQAATPFEVDERKRLKAAIETTDPQLWLACEIQYYCAIRPGTELRLMKIGWIDFDRSKIRIPSVESKSRRVDVVDVPEFLIEKLRHYKAYDRNLYLFGKYGQPNQEPVGKNTLRNRFNRYREALNIPNDRKFYSWKHTGAIQLLDNGIQPYDLKEHLRHRSFATTEIYIKKKAGNTSKVISRFSTEI
ncbi:MAG: tyrosine-type recombinase/integrase [Paludibacter sp.]|nr:tyrosine-type recombinase/integrase [Paludibacter sp.]